MTVLLIGGYGLLGSDIYRVFKESGIHILRFTKDELNLLDRKNLTERILASKPSLVIHAGGYTNVPLAETNLDDAFQVNCVGMYNLIHALRRSKASVVYFSTDYVFDGNKENSYEVEDEPNPLNKYGWTKLLSEDIVRANVFEHYIIRTSWLFGVHGKCFPDTIIRKLRNGDQVNVVSDQFGTPTYTFDLASALLKVTDKDFGTYHVTNGGYTNWFDYACLIAKELNLNMDLLNPISSSQMSSNVIRPSFSVLNNDKWGDQLRLYSDAVIDFCQVYKFQNDREMHNGCSIVRTDI